MKGREIRELLQGKHDPQLVYCIASVAEEISAMGQEIQALAELQNSMIDLIAAMQEITEATQKAVEHTGGKTLEKRIRDSKKRKH